jgi:hypothetical protein
MSLHVPTSIRTTLKAGGLAAVTAGALLASTVGPAAASPAYDNFVFAQFLPGKADTIGTTNSGATAEAGEPNHVPGNAASRSVWLKWTAPASGMTTFDSTGSEFDTVMAVYSGSTMSSLIREGDNDDIAPGNTASRVRFFAKAGTQYRIAVDGYRGAQGRVKVSWANNDDFEASQSIPDPVGSTSPSTNAKTVFGMTRGATRQIGEPLPSAASVWFTWTASKTGAAEVQTMANNFDTTLGVYTGSTVGGLTTIGTNDNLPGSSSTSSQVKFNATAGTTYRIAVDGKSGATGSFVMRYSLI